MAESTSAGHVILIGAGPAGCSAARTLADRGVDVVLLEAGPGSERPPELEHRNHLLSGQAREWWWPGNPRRGRGIGGGSAVNGMVLQGIDPLDVRRWQWSDAPQHQQAILNQWSIEHLPAGPFTSAFAQLVTRGFPEGESTSVSGSVGWSQLALGLREGRRWSAADAFLADAPPTLSVRPNAQVDRIVGHHVVLESGESLVADRIAVAAGAIGSASLLLRSGLITADAVDPPQNHLSSVVVVELDETLQVRGEFSGPSNHLLRTASGLSGNRVDLQMLVLDHTGDSADGRRYGAVIVSALEADRQKVLIAGLNQVLRWLAELPGVLGVALSDEQTPVQHHCCTLTAALGGSTTVPVASHVSVIDSSTLPALPHTNPMLSVMIGARRWATGTSLG